MNLSEPEGYIDSAEAPLVPRNGFLECTFWVTVYTGYGVELQVGSPLEGWHGRGLLNLGSGLGSLHSFFFY